MTRPHRQLIPQDASLPLSLRLRAAADREYYKSLAREFWDDIARADRESFRTIQREAMRGFWRSLDDDRGLSDRTQWLRARRALDALTTNLSKPPTRTTDHA
jgi:hypothetical protein